MTLTTEPKVRQRTEGEHCGDHGINLAKVALGKRLLLENEVYQDLAETFRTLADPTRAKILYSLLHQEMCTCDLAAMLGLSEPAVSQHLRVLRQSRVVRSRREGKLVYYALDDAHVRTLLNVALSHRLHDQPETVASDGGEEEDVGGY